MHVFDWELEENFFVGEYIEIWATMENIFDSYSKAALIAIAPYVEEWSYIDFVDDGKLFRWAFENGTVITKHGTVVWKKGETV